MFVEKYDTDDSLRWEETDRLTFGHARVNLVIRQAELVTQVTQRLDMPLKQIRTLYSGGNNYHIFSHRLHR